MKYFIDQLKQNLQANIDSVQLLAELEEVISGNRTPAVATTTATEVPAEVLEVSSEKDLSYNQSVGEFIVKNVPDAAMFAELEMPPRIEMPENSAAKVLPAQASKKESGATDESIRVSLFKLEKLINYVGEMVILQTVLREQSNQTNSDLLKKSVHQLGRVSKEIQDLSMGLRMLPIKPIFQKMQRIVRDTSSALDKKVNFILEGEETAVDKTVLDQISDPLVHLVRNAVDHGLETNEKRSLAGKNIEGTIILKAFHRGDKLIIEVVDDGGGINPEIISAKAIEKGLIPQGHNLTKKQIVDLVFHPGFSTKAQTTDISGRGVGMDVVKTNIEGLQGSIEIETEVNKGSTFRIMLPLTLAIIDGLVLESSDDYFIVPLSQVRDSMKPKIDQVQFNKDVGETLLCRGENIPLYRLDFLLKNSSKTRKIEDSIVVIIKGLQRDFGLVVDDIKNQQQVVIKKLGAELKNINGFSGSAILGSGKPALILEPIDLVNYYISKNVTIDFPLKNCG